MTHIFISYCHKDKDSLEVVLDALRTNELGDEVWFDQYIEAGNQWIPQIDAALREAYALVVIVTPDSMTSTYVTYEWSSALGSSTTIFPLLLKGDYNIVHKRLLLEQVVDCRNGIPNSLIELIKSKRATPPDTIYLNWTISEALMQFRIANLVTLWFYSHADNPKEGNKRLLGLIDGMLDETRDLYGLKLPELILSRAYAFHQKQLRMCRALINFLQEYWEIFTIQFEDHNLYGRRRPSDSVPSAKDYFRENLTPIFSSLYTSDNFREEAYLALETYLSELDQQESDRWHYFLDRTAIIGQTFKKDNEYGKLLQETIEIVANHFRNP